MSRFRRVAFVLLAAWSFPMFAATPAVPPDIEKMFATIRRDVFIYPIPSSDHIGNVLETLIHDEKKTREIVEQLQRKFSLPPAAAHAVVRAWGITAIVNDIDEQRSADRAARANEAAALWHRAYELAPIDAVALEAVAFLANLDLIEGRYDSIRTILRTAPDGRSVAIAALNKTYDDEASRILFDAAVAGKSEDPMLLLAAAQKPYQQALALAAYERRQGLGMLSVEQEAALTEQAIEVLTANGQASEAIAIFESARAAVRASILENAGRFGGYVHFHRGIIELEVQRRSVGSLLAAAYALEGNSAQANAILPAIRNARARADESDRSAFDEIIDRLVAAEAGLGKEDPFEIAAGFVAATEDHQARTDDVVVLRLFERFARAEGYGEIAAFMNDRARGHRADENRSLASELMPYVRRFTPPAAQASASSQPLSTEPRLVLFQERNLAEATSRIVADCTSVERLRQEGVVFPEGVAPLRAERRGNDVVAMILSQRVDPVGEISGGGYWVLRSVDAGATWQYLYTGLHQYQPYVVSSVSSLPLFDESRLTIEVEVRELDESSISFPPVALRTKREARNLFIEFSWDAITRDSDEDGLTDLLEERLLLDAYDPDTDHDGVRDAEDPLPQVAFHDAANIAAEVLETVFAPATPSVGGALITGLDDPASSCNAPRLSQWVPAARFVIGERSSFASLRPSSPMIVLSAAELNAAREKFGTFFAASVTPVVVDRTGTKAVVAVNESWRANVYRLEKKNGKWTLTMIGGWIS